MRSPHWHCSACVQNVTDEQNSFERESAQHATVGIEALRCTDGAGESTNAAWDWVMEVAFRDRTD
jgi:hypothetical protein